jgi:hypothetical protein
MQKCRIFILLAVLTLLSLVTFSSVSVHAATWPTPGGMFGSAAAIDNEGSLLVIGSSTPFSDGESQAFFFKFVPSLPDSPIYQRTCMRTFGGSEPLDTFGYGVTTDVSDNIYVTGTTQTFGGENYNMFIQKYDWSCNLLWTQQWGGAGNDIPHGITTDTIGNVYVVGSTDSFGNGVSQIFLLKYNLDGGLVFSQTWGNQNSYGNGVAVDNLGNVYVVGTTNYHVAGSQIVLLKYDSSGNLLSTRMVGGGSQNSYGTGVAVDGAGNVYVTGYGYGFAPTPGVSTVILLKYDTLGNLVLQTTWGGKRSDAATGIAVDIDGNVYLTGYTKTYSVTPDIPSAFLLKFDPSGNLILQRVWGGNRGDFGYGIAVDTAENAYITGYTFSFGPNTQGANFFILKYDMGGNLQWTKLYGGGVPNGSGYPNGP